jgi:hypothetical protein
MGVTEVAHRIVDVRYSELWCECTCGAIVKSEDYWQMPTDWAAHRKDSGAKKVVFSDSARAPYGGKGIFNGGIGRKKK